MTDITKKVGNKGNNLVHDVALVQAMLRLVKDAKQQTYFTVDYTGIHGDSTVKAITRFQEDQGLGYEPPPPPTAKAPANAKAEPPPPGKELYGTMEPNGVTLKKLVAMLPADYAGLRIIPNTKTVYLPGTQADATKSETAVTTYPSLVDDFRQKVAKLVNLMYARHKIVLSVPNDGWRRTFEQQANVGGANTGAGPGESNHNFGRAVDIGFNGLRWLKGNGTIQKDDYWLQKLALVSEAKAKELWNARNDIGITELKLNKTNKKGDIVHLQSFSDDNLSMARSLAKLLNTVGTTKWEAQPGIPNHYKSDLGEGGKTFAVGTTKEIWKGQAGVTKEMVVTARNAAAQQKFKDALKKNNIAPPAAGNAAAQKAYQEALAKAGIQEPKLLKVPDIKEEELKTLRLKLKGDFQLADQGWKQWEPVKKF